MVAAEIVTPDSAAFDIARKKAKHGHKTWLVYRRADGSHVARIYTAGAIKAAMLASGTQGKFSVEEREHWNRKHLPVLELRRSPLALRPRMGAPWLFGNMIASGISP